MKSITTKLKTLTHGFADRKGNPLSSSASKKTTMNLRVLSCNLLFNNATFPADTFDDFLWLLQGVH